MKFFNKPFRVLLLVFTFCQVQQLFAQVPQQINYQGALRDSKGNPIVNQPITLRLSIQDQGANGLIHYYEVRSVTTNAVGLYTVAIGSPGALDSKGNFSTIPWGISPKFLKVEVDPEGGYTYMNAGLTQLLSVPYSLYAKYAENGPIGPTGPVGPAGANGLSAFEIWQQLPGNAGKTLQEYVDGLTGADGRSVTGAQLDAAGNLVLTFSDNTTTNVGQVIGPAGVQGLQGTDGRSVTGAQLDAAGNLVLTFSDNTTINVGQVIGPAGVQGLQGADGRSITGTQLDAAGNLVIAFSDNTTSNVGKVTGPAGPAGPAGAPGAMGLEGLSAFEIWQKDPINENKTVEDFLNSLKGVSVLNTKITEDTGELIVFLSNETSINAGVVVGPQGKSGPAGPIGPIGPIGPNGINCWDTNMNGINDPGEDTNGDGMFNTLDCAAVNSNPTLTDGHIFVGNPANFPGDVAMSGDATITNGGVVTVSDGAITLNKMADGPPGLIYTTDINGKPFLQSFNGLGWALQGNSGTEDGVNYLGTRDDRPLNFRINNEKAGRISNDQRGETTLGYRAGISATGAIRNTLIGLRAGEGLTSGSHRNTLIGALAGYSMSGNSSNQNTGIGQLALLNLGGGSANTAIGNESGNFLTAGNDNVFIGNKAGLTNPGSAINCLVVGNDAAADPGLTNAAAIGNNAQVKSSNSMVLGGNGVNAVNIGINTTTPSQRFDVNGGNFRLNDGVFISDQNAASNMSLFVPIPSGTVINAHAGNVSMTNVKGQIAAEGENNTLNYTVIVVTFSSPTPYLTPPAVQLTPANAAAADADYYVTSSVNGFSIFYKNKTANQRDAAFNYWVIQ